MIFLRALENLNQGKSTIANEPKSINSLEHGLRLSVSIPVPDVAAWYRTLPGISSGNRHPAG